ncbi:GGDEF domain-containing protein [Vibrio sp. 10N]|uniref:GGDEF domain-containing protein n=1 Tax=Vibrio sp. 10N TaxID=3058938 RepID=UPI00281465F8|nr:GGDEF domain-containing protein [Vibrio sp. 10N]
MDTLTAFSLDMRTLNFVMILFSIIYCIGLLLFSQTQEKTQGLKLFAVALLVMGSGPLLISLRGVAPDWVSIVAANTLVSISFHMILVGLCQFRGVDIQFARRFSWVIPVVLLFNLYFTYEANSINQRILVSALSIAVVTLATAFVVLVGKQRDYKPAVLTMAATFGFYGLFMLFRAFYTWDSPEILHFMSADLVHKMTFLFSIFLTVASSFSMLWLINARQVDDIYALSYFDSLTNLRNRRALDSYTLAFTDNGDKLKHKQSIIMLDIDKFKLINDRYGHVIGDKVIKAVAEQIKGTSNAPKSIYRFGGDEFIIVLNHQTIDFALFVAESMRKRVADHVKVNGLPIQVSCSFGVAESLPDESWDALVARADEALYRAKQTGRNCVQSASDQAQLLANV